MDLTKTFPRSPNDKLLGLVSLKRTIDKAKAHNEGHLGEYHYDCPHDKPLFEFLGVDAATFAQKVRELESDDRIADWIRREYLSKKTPDQIEAFNEERLQWHPEPGTDGDTFYKSERTRLGREDLQTWFDLLDVDEGREVGRPTIVRASASR